MAPAQRKRPHDLDRTIEVGLEDRNSVESCPLVQDRPKVVATPRAVQELQVDQRARGDSPVQEQWL
jgi:hypothetical protein